METFTALSIEILCIVKVMINCMKQEIKIICLSNIVTSLVESLIHQVFLNTNYKLRCLLDREVFFHFLQFNIEKKCIELRRIVFSYVRV